MIEELLAATPPEEREALEAQLRELALRYQGYPQNAIPRLAREAVARYRGGLNG